MDLSNRHRTVLLAIVILNLISTWLHYTDNALFLERYPGPEWFTPLGIIVTVIVMTPIGLLGYWVYTKDKFWLAYLLLGLYSLTSVSSLGHYLAPIVVPMSVKMHILIWLDGFAGVSLIVFLLCSGVVWQEWRRMPATD